MRERNHLTGLSPDLKDGHDGCRKGVKVCRGVVFKDEPVRKIWHIWSLKILFFSQREINRPPRQAGWLMELKFFLHVLCILEASSYTRPCLSTSASLYCSDKLVGNSLRLGGKQSSNSCVCVWQRHSLKSLPSSHSRLVKQKQLWTGHRTIYSLLNSVYSIKRNLLGTMELTLALVFMLCWMCINHLYFQSISLWAHKTWCIELWALIFHSEGRA